MTPAPLTSALRRLRTPRPGLQRALRDRAVELGRALQPHEPAADPQTLLDTLTTHLAGADPSVVWLTLATLRAELPLEPEVVATARRIRLDGVAPVLAELLAPSLHPLRRARQLRRVEVVRTGVLVDLSHTSRTSLATGIQRVARQCAVQWQAQHAPTLVGWTADHRALRRLTDDEVRVALHGGEVPDTLPPDATVVVPWGATYLLPELATESERTLRLGALAQWSTGRTGVIGFDCVPLSSGETVGEAMGAAFAVNLAAVRHMDAVATISQAAATEYRGWRQMLVGIGVPGPDVAAVSLPVVAMGEGDPDDDTEGSLPLVLCVGSHEPRKNHAAVLHAAELAWRRGARFELLFVGGNAWNSEGLLEHIDELQRAGRPVSSARGLSDEKLSAAYRRARCVMFPSLNEGFGLPVAEALAVGTPVITSGFGSMAEIAAHGGALLVDPRDDASVADALYRLISDDDLHDQLAHAALAGPRGTWQAYADAVWGYLVEGREPAPAATPLLT